MDRLKNIILISSNRGDIYRDSNQIPPKYSPITNQSIMLRLEELYYKWIPLNELDKYLKPMNIKYLIL
jgi:hypothetical protein